MGSYFDPSVARLGVGSQWDDLIRSTAASLGLDPGMIKAVISAESAWNPVAVSFNNSSFGLMQLNVAAQGITKAQALDPTFAIPFAAQILLHQIQTRPDLGTAIAAYNAGTSRTNADLQTRVAANTNGVGTYVTTVLAYLGWFQANDPAPGAATTTTDPGTIYTGSSYGTPPDATLPPADGGGAGGSGFPDGPDDGGGAARPERQPDPGRSGIFDAPQPIDGA